MPRNRPEPMRPGIAALFVAYILSQFYRAFLAVLTPVLGTDLGATPQALAEASGYWFLSFALMQLPIGWALDRIGPRLTTAALLVVAAGGAAVFATATGSGQIKLAIKCCEQRLHSRGAGLIQRQFTGKKACVKSFQHLDVFDHECLERQIRRVGRMRRD